jgi:predicted helicase
VRYDRIKWSESLKLNVKRYRYAEFGEEKLRAALYRPFTRQLLFFDAVLDERLYQFPQIMPVPKCDRVFVWMVNDSPEPVGGQGATIRALNAEAVRGTMWPQPQRSRLGIPPADGGRIRVSDTTAEA